MATPVIDIDGHIAEPPDIWEKYLAPAFREIAPRLVRTETGAEAISVAGKVFVPNGALGMPAGNLAGQKVGPRTMYERRYQDGHPGGFDPKARLAVMDQEGIDIAILFPTFSAPMIAAIPTEEFGIALARAYNDWMADFCRTAPERLFGVAQIPLLHLNSAIAEAQRAVRTLGHRILYLRPNLYGGRPWTDKHWDPLWACVQELKVPIAFHEGTCPEVLPTAGADRFGNFFFQHMVSHPFEQQLSCLSLLAGGILERFPTLQVLFLEAGCGWVPYWLERMDHHWEKIGWMVPEISQRPSEYFRRQGWVTFDPDDADVPYVAEEIGADKLLFASDFPHYDAIFPGAVSAVRAQSGISDEVKAMILGGNAARLLRL